MNNTINSVSNISFNARYIDMKKLDKLPPQIKEAILKSPAMDEFIKAGNPKTLWGKFVDLFKKDEVLEIFHSVKKERNNPDIYAQDELLIFSLKPDEYSFVIPKSQKGIMRKSGSIPKPNENPLFKKPEVTATEKLVNEIGNIKDFSVLLK